MSVTLHLPVPGHAPTRQQAWAALAAGPHLERLHVIWGLAGSGFQSASAGELQLLASVPCTQLIASDLLGLPSAQQFLGARCCEQLLCHNRYSFTRPALSWSHLSSRAGAYVLEVCEMRCCTELNIGDCWGALPAFCEPWALIIVTPPEWGGMLHGLPLHSFKPGPFGHLAWTNPAMSRAGLTAACELLGLDQS